MAARLNQLRSKATEISQFVSKHGCSYYKDLMQKNKHYVVDPPTIETCQELSKKLFYTRLASNHDPLFKEVNSIPYNIPGRYQSFWKELDGVKNIWKNRSELKVEDAGIAALFGLELYCWYCAGEIAGRGFTFTGYKV